MISPKKDRSHGWRGRECPKMKWMQEFYWNRYNNNRKKKGKEEMRVLLILQCVVASKEIEEMRVEEGFWEYMQKRLRTTNKQRHRI